MAFKFYQENWGSGTIFYILAEGTITSETPKQFYQFARKLLDSDSERPDFVFFNSLGGNLAAALEMGTMIRRLGLNTLVGGKYKAIGKDIGSQVTIVDNGVCYSACAYAFLGGVGRRVTESGTFGVHQFYGAQKDSEASAQVTMTILTEYLNAMGVDRELLTVASLTPSKKMGVLTVKQAQELNIDNSNPPRSQWKIAATSSGRIYAYVTQKQPLRNATTTFFLMKESNLYKGKILYQIKQMFRSSEELMYIFGDACNTSLQINGQEFLLKTIGGWKAEEDGIFAIDFVLDTKIIGAMTRSQEIYFNSWFAEANRDVNPSVKFSTEGLQRVIAALSRQNP